MQPVLRRIVVTGLVALLLTVGVPARADVQGDLAATGIELHRQADGNWMVTLHWTVDTWADFAPFTYTRTLTIRRNGEFWAQPLSEAETLEPQNVCNYPNDSCRNNKCHYKIKGRPAPFEGTCGLRTTGSGSSGQGGEQVCSCNSVGSRTLIIELMAGDELVFSVTPSPGFHDDDPANDSLTVTVE